MFFMVKGLSRCVFYVFFSMFFCLRRCFSVFSGVEKLVTWIGGIASTRRRRCNITSLRCSGSGEGVSFAAGFIFRFFSANVGRIRT